MSIGGLPNIYTAYANYFIYFADQAAYDAAVVACGGTTYLHCPSTAAIQFGISPFPPPANVTGNPKGIVSPQYSIQSPGTEIRNPRPSGIYLSPSVDYKVAPGQQATFMSGAGPDLKLVWCGNLVKLNNPSSSSGHVALPQRRWMVGFEFNDDVEIASGSGSAIGTEGRSRDASRTVDGFGYAIRGTNVSSSALRTNIFNPSYHPTKSWERFYIRIRKDGTTDVYVWRTLGFLSLTEEDIGAAVKLDSARTLSIVHRNNGVNTVLGVTSSPLVLNKWYKIDVILEYVPSPGTARIRLWINGSLSLTGTITNGTGMNHPSGYYHYSSILCANTDADLEYDLDDWICSDIPGGGSESLTSLDWQSGTHIRSHYNNSFGASNVWTGSYHVLNNAFIGRNASGNDVSVSNAVSDAVLDAVTDVADVQNMAGIFIGASNALVCIVNRGAVEHSDSKLGYSIAGASPVLTDVGTYLFRRSHQAAYFPTGRNVPFSTIVPFDNIYKHAPNTDNDTVQALQTEIEYVGVWGSEDDVNKSDIPKVPHNCRYPNTVWAHSYAVPDAPVAAVSGVYTGNGTGQSINLPFPAHFLFIRGVDTTTNDVPTMLFGSSQPNYVSRCFVDSSGQAKFVVGGSSTRINENGKIYQYVAFCDPGMRYNLCGEFLHNTSLASAVNSFIDGDFNPTGVLVYKQVWDEVDTLIGKTSFKGSNAAVKFDGNELADWGTFETGKLTSGVDLHSDVKIQPSYYSAWRPDDGTTQVMCQILSYVGNGSSSRTITLTPTSGRFPIFGFIIPHDGTIGVYRDASHVDDESSRLNSTTTTITDGITDAGIDSVTVGIALNANGVTYDVFVICGDVDAMEGVEDTFYPIDYIAPGDNWIPPTFDPDIPSISIMGEGGLIFDGTPPLSLIKDLSGIYTLVTNQRHDTVYDRQSGQTSVDLEIPDPIIKTGYIGG